MGFWSKLFKSKSKQQAIIIPQHIKEKEYQMDEKIRISAKQGLGSFKVSGIFGPKGTSLILGKTLSGQIRAGMKTIVNEKELIILEVGFDRKTVEQLLANQDGSILLNKFTTRIEIGDILEFKLEK